MESDAMDRDQKLLALLGRVASQQKLHEETITTLFEHIQTLHTTINIVCYHASPFCPSLTSAQIRPSNVAAVIRRELDNARYCFARALMIVFPKHFLEKQIINPLDPRGSIVVWYKFKEALELHYGKHFEDGLQKLSVFSSMDFNTVVGVRNTRYNLMTLTDPLIPRYEVNHIPIPVVHIFEKSIINKAYLKQLNITDDAEALLYDIYRFYFPVFIWAYNTLKLLLIEDDLAIGILEDLYNANKNGAKELVFTNTEPDYSRFDVGTGWDVRHQEYYKTHLRGIRNDARARSMYPLEHIPEPVIPEVNSATINLIKSLSDRSAEKRPLAEAFDNSIREVKSLFNSEAIPMEISDDEDNRATKRRNVGGSNNNRKRNLHHFVCFPLMLFLQRLEARLLVIPLPQIAPQRARQSARIARVEAHQSRFPS